MRKDRNGNPTICTLDLTYMVAELLELPVYQRGKANDIVKAIFKTIKDALLRGERVSLPHMGYLEVYETKPIKRYLRFYHEGVGVSDPTYVQIPSKKKVHFVSNPRFKKTLGNEPGIPTE